MFNSVEIIKPIFVKYKLRIIGGMIALIGVDLCQLFIPRFIKKAIDGLDSASVNISKLQTIAIYIVLLALGVAIFRFLWRFLILGFSRLLERDIRNKIFSHLLSLDRSFFQKRTTGELMALSTNDLSAIQLACGMGLVSFLDALFMSVAIVLFMLYISPLLTLIALSPLPILAVATKILSKKLHSRFSKVQEQFSDLSEFARSTISSIRLIKIYTREKDLINKFNELGETYINLNVQVAKIRGTLFPVSGFIGNASLLLVVLIGGMMSISNTITVGDLVAFISYLFMMTWPMMAIGWVANLFQRGVTSLSRIESVLQETTLFKESTNLEPFTHQIQSVSLQNLSFSYPQSHQFALTINNFKITSGITGIIGPTGSGKTTICHILARLYPVAEKCIFINNQDINLISINNYRSKVAYVPQEPLLFSESIAFNISFGSKTANQEQIEQAAQQAGIHDEIVTFKDGYQTRIGEKGLTLSGGQRQRVSLARALLSNAEMLIIDNGLSAVDATTEEHILQSVQRYSLDKIVIIVTHRLTTIANAQSITVFDKGTLVDFGDHQHLSQSNTFYQALMINQSDSTRNGF